MTKADKEDEQIIQKSDQLRIISFFSRKESRIFRIRELKNKTKINLWYFPHLIIPISVVVFAGIIYSLTAVDDDDFSYVSLINLFVNGSLPLICVHQVSSIAPELIENLSDSKIEGIDLFHSLKVKLFYLNLLAIMLAMVFFVIQVIAVPFINELSLFIHLAISILLVVMTTFFTKKVYVLQSKFSENYDENIESGTQEKSNSLRENFGNYESH